MRQVSAESLSGGGGGGVEGGACRLCLGIPFTLALFVCYDYNYFVIFTHVIISITITTVLLIT